YDADKEHPAVNDFMHWLNDRRGLQVSQAFHEIVACYRAAILAAQPPTQQASEPAAPVHEGTTEPAKAQSVTEAMIHKVGQAIWNASGGDFEPTKDEIRAICNAVLAASQPTPEQPQ